MQARIRSASWEAIGVLRYRLEPMPGQAFPPFTAGSHINLLVDRNLVRSYSILNSPGDRFYEIAVQLDPSSRGGSRTVHERFRPGDIVEFTGPENHFPLMESAAHSILIAGGIGITPLMSMAARLEVAGCSWELHFAARSREHAAFLDVVQEWSSTCFYDGQDRSMGRMNLAEIIRGATPGSHFYCCGPAKMIEEFKRLTATVESERIHLEYFAADTQCADDGGYTLDLARSGKQIAVQPGETMLDALLNAGVNIGFACSEGICGTCKVKVLCGEPDHRDLFLSEAEKSSNQAVMVCCSGSRSSSLVLDL